jgi:hypothetical protein
MKCHKCGAKLHKRVIEPFGIKEPVTVYECRSALCEYDEDDDPRRWRRRWGYPR